MPQNSEVIDALLHKENYVVDPIRLWEWLQKNRKVLEGQKKISGELAIKVLMAFKALWVYHQEDPEKRTELATMFEQMPIIISRNSLLIGNVYCDPSQDADALRTFELKALRAVLKDTSCKIFTDRKIASELRRVLKLPLRDRPAMDLFVGQECRGRSWVILDKSIVTPRHIAVRMGEGTDCTVDRQQTLHWRIDDSVLAPPNFVLSKIFVPGLKRKES